MSKDFFTEQEILFLLQKRQNNEDFDKITTAFNKKFKKNRSIDSIASAHRRYKDYTAGVDTSVKALKDKLQVQRRSSVLQKESRDILEHIANKESLVESIQEAVKKINKSKPVKVKVKKSVSKKNMTLELLVSDVHFGKKTNTVNGEAIRNRVRKMANVTLDEITRESKNFNVHRIIVAIIGDIIESSHFHGTESEKSCEFGTARQVQEAIESLFLDLLEPLAKTGLPIDVPCITGNHDRLELEKTYVNPGENNLSWIIYNSLALICKQSGYNNVKFDICRGSYTHLHVYDNVIIYEHGDELKNLNRDTMLNMMAKRQASIGKIAHFYRVGHWHNVTSYEQGKVIVNGSVPGQDSYADVKGFDSDAIQVLNTYIETKSRKNCFFRSFPIYLGNVFKEKDL